MAAKQRKLSLTDQADKVLDIETWGVSLCGSDELNWIMYASRICALCGECIAEHFSPHSAEYNLKTTYCDPNHNQKFQEDPQKTAAFRALLRFKGLKF